MICPSVARVGASERLRNTELMRCSLQDTLALLFPLLRPGGMYVVEDIHSGLQVSAW